jgi:hypothetical protein
MRETTLLLRFQHHHLLTLQHLQFWMLYHLRHHHRHLLELQENLK